MKSIGWVTVVAIVVFLFGLGTQIMIRPAALPRPASKAATPVAQAPTPTRMPTATRAPNAVTLRAATGNAKVQMFDALSDDSDVTVLRSGTECTKLDGPTRIAVGGVSMSFYKLDCNGKIGYVNTKWTR